MKRTCMTLSALGFVLILILGTIGIAYYALSAADVTTGWTWVLKQPLHSPGARQGAAMAYDSDNQKVILFGGFDQTSQEWFRDTWVWNGEDWAALHPVNAPPAAYTFAIAYDKFRKETVLFTGEQTWVLTYDGENASWERRFPLSSPPSGWGHTMAFDSLSNVVVLFGGYGYDSHFIDSTWEWDGTNWTEVAVQGPIPDERNEAKIAYIGNGKSLLYSGHHVNYYLNSTWAYDSTTKQWTCLCSSSAFSCPACSIPSDRSYHFMAYDPDSDLVVLFGGYFAYRIPERFDETWVWDGLNWMNVPFPDEPSAHPSRRCNHSSAMVYDESRHEMVLFGGQLEPGTVCAGDTWILRKKTYAFEGFLSPIQNLPTINEAKGGQVIPLKWRIAEMSGLPISDPASFISITSYSADCAAFQGDPTNLVEEYTSGSSGLQYLGDGWWQFNWKTAQAYKGQCRTMKLSLDDHSEHLANFSFK